MSNLVRIVGLVLALGDAEDQFTSLFVAVERLVAGVAFRTEVAAYSEVEEEANTFAEAVATESGSLRRDQRSPDLLSQGGSLHAHLG